MDFLEAAKFLDKGYSIKRSGWDNKDRIIKYLKEKDSFVTFSFKECKVEGIDKLSSDWILFWE